MADYLKLVGSMDLPLVRYPLQEDRTVVSEVLFGKRSDAERLRAGDRLVLYAVGGSKAIFAIVRLSEDPAIDRHAGDPARTRWPHGAACVADPDEVVEDLQLAPPLADACPRLAQIGLRDRSVLEMNPDEFAQARALIRRRAISARARSAVQRGR